MKEEGNYTYYNRKVHIENKFYKIWVEAIKLAEFLKLSFDVIFANNKKHKILELLKIRL